MLFGVLIMVFALVALVSIVSLTLSKFDGTFLHKLEQLITEYDGVIISLSTLFLVSTLTLMTAHISNRSAERRERTNWKIQAELKISEFRQQWINELRIELSELAQIFADGHAIDDRARALALYSSIRMRLNLQESKSNDLFKSLKAASAACVGGDKEKKGAEISKFVRLSQEVLKIEWERLKTDLENAQSSIDKIP